MSRFIRTTLPVWLVITIPSLFAQSTDVEPPGRQAPLKPATRQELDHLEAVKLYGLGVVREHQNRLLDATRIFEEARRYDPDSAAVHRALIPLYFALDRIDDALEACRRTLEIEPDDYSTGYRYARQLRAVGRNKEALDVLTRTAECARLKDRLEMRAQVFFDLSQMQEEAGESGKAEKSLLEVLSILDNPAALMEQGPYNREEIVSQSAETHERLGKLYLKQKKSAEAVAEFEEAIKRDPLRSARLGLNVAEVHIARGEPEKALSQVEQYLGSLPRGMEGYELRIKLQRELKRDTDVLPSLIRSAAADHNNAALQLLLAREYRHAGRADLAEPIYRKLLAQSPTAEVYRGLFQLYKEDKNCGGDRLLAQLDEAVGKASGDKGDGKKEELDEAQREAAQLAAAQARTMLSVLREDAEMVKLLLSASTTRLTSNVGLRFTTAIMLASLAGRTRLFDEAERLYRYSLKLREGTRDEAEIYVGLLTVLSMAHKNQAIIEVCKRGLAKADNTNRLLFLREMASAYMALNHVRESLATIDEAVKIAGDSKLSCRLERAQLLSLAERHESALDECRALLKEYNQGGDAHRIRALMSGIYSTAHQYEKAEEQLLLILRDDPDDATANNDLGYLWADQNKKLEEAEKRIRRALELDKRQRNSLLHIGLNSDLDNAAFVDSLGWVNFRKGDWQAARIELEKASRLPNGDDDPVVWDHLGDVYFRLKETEKAKSAWRKAIELYESGGRRRPDERYRDIKVKLQQSS
jgi:tetratricopeptide (TPR) repeat protein